MKKERVGAIPAPEARLQRVPKQGVEWYGMSLGREFERAARRPIPSTRSGALGDGKTGVPPTGDQWTAANVMARSAGVSAKVGYGNLRLLCAAEEKQRTPIPTNGSAIQAHVYRRLMQSLQLQAPLSAYITQRFPTGPAARFGLSAASSD